MNPVPVCDALAPSESLEFMLVSRPLCAVAATAAARMASSAPDATVSTWRGAPTSRPGSRHLKGSR